MIRRMGVVAKTILFVHSLLHLTGAIEEASFTNHEDRGEKISIKFARGVYFHPPLGMNLPLHTAIDDDGMGFDLPIHDCRFSDD